jgi:hypothetical protein
MKPTPWGGESCPAGRGGGRKEGKDEENFPKKREEGWNDFWVSMHASMHEMGIHNGGMVCQPEDGRWLDFKVALTRNVGRLAVTLPLARRGCIQPHRSVRADGQDEHKGGSDGMSGMSV